MAFDISGLQSILAGNSTSYASGQNKTAFNSSFEDYFLNAMSTSEKKREDGNSLYKDLSSFGSSSALSTLLGSNPNNNALISSYLTSSGANPSYFDEQAMQNTFSSYLQNNFQAKQMNLLAAAKDNLSAKAADFKAQIGDNPSEAQKFRLEQMNRNVEQLTTYFVQKNEETTKNQSLLDQLNNSSALSQYTLFKNSTL